MGLHAPSGHARNDEAEATSYVRRKMHATAARRPFVPRRRNLAVSSVPRISIIPAPYPPSEGAVDASRKGVFVGRLLDLLETARASGRSILIARLRMRVPFVFAIRALAACGALSVGCAPAVPVAATVCPPSAPAVEAPARAEVKITELVQRPIDTPCVVRGAVTRSDVTWKLRTRLDVVPTLGVVEGAVTAWIRDDQLPNGDGPNGVVEVESAVMRVRARVASEDLVVVIPSPVVALDTFVPDSITDRQVTRVEFEQLSIDVGMPGVSRSTLVVPCHRVTLERKRDGVGSLLPPALGETTVRLTAKVHTANGDLPIAWFAVGHGSEVPHGLVVTVHERHGDRSMISIAACGGTVFGTVGKGDLLGPSRIAWGSNFRCADTGTHVFIQPQRLTHRKRCARELPLLIRSSTLEDAVGVLKANAMFRIDGHENGATTLITIASPAAEALAPAHFSVRTADLATCTDAADDAS
jgi:hypothetical protein